jgi:hypothetical protein
MGGTHRSQVGDLVLAAPGARDQVVGLQASPPRAAGHPTLRVSQQHRPTQLRRDRREPTPDRQRRDENVIRFASVKQARRLAAAFDDYLRDGPQCGVVNARGDDGEVFELARIEALDLGSVGDRSAAIASDSPIEGVPDRFLAIVRTGRAVILVEAFESAQIDEARFVQLVDAVAAAS